MNLINTIKNLYNINEDTAIDKEIAEAAKFQDSLVKKAMKVAKRSSGNFDAAWAKIEKIKKGLGDFPIVAKALKLANEGVEQWGDELNEEELDEGKTPISDKWGKTPKLKIGDVELIRGKSGVHTIKKSGKSVGDFSLEDDSDMWVVNYVNRRGQGTFSDLDAMVKDIQTTKESVDEGREDLKKAFLKGPKKTGKDVEKELKKVKAGSKLSIQHNKGIGRSGVGGGVVISVKGDKVKIKPTASNEPSEIDAKDITFMTLMKESVDESKPAGYGNTDVKVGDEFEKNKLTLKVIAVNGKKVTVKKKGKKQSLMPITQFDTWTKINESVETDLDALFEEELREDYFNVQYYNGNKNAVDDKFKNFKTKAEADKYAKRGNLIDRVGGEYKVFKVKGRMESVEEAVSMKNAKGIGFGKKGGYDKYVTLAKKKNAKSHKDVLKALSREGLGKEELDNVADYVMNALGESVELGEAKWKLTTMSAKDAIKKFGKDKVRVGHFKMRDNSKSVEINEAVLDEVNNGLGSFVSQMKLLLKDPKAKKAHSAASSLIMRAQEKGAMAKTAIPAIKKALPGLAKSAGGSWEKKILGMKTMMIEEVELDEAKGSDCTIQNDGRNNIAVCIDGLTFADARKGTRAAMMNITDFKKKAKVAYADSKGKPTLPSVKKEIKALGAKNFYAKWQADSSSYKDDSVQIWFTK